MLSMGAFPGSWKCNRRKMAKHRKSHGHYCKVCGQYRANEKFSGKGHAAHICKDCAKLSPAQRAEEMTLNRLFDLPWYLSKEQIKWLRNRTHDGSPKCGRRPRNNMICVLSGNTRQTMRIMTDWKWTRMNRKKNSGTGMLR